MTNWNFNRGLSDKFVKQFNELYEDAGGKWLKNLVDDPGIFFAIRENYANFYYRGCSLLRLECASRQEDKIVGHIHYKYLLNPSIKPEYLKVVNGTAQLPKKPRDLFLHSIDVRKLKESASPYAGAEKTGVHEIIMGKNNQSVLDVEIAFSAGRSASRIDVATLQETNSDPTLMFFEAKHFKNKDLRQRAAEDPKVIHQMNGYAEILKTHKTRIAKCYTMACKNLLALRGVYERKECQTELLERVANNDAPLTVNVEPRLVVFGYDDDQARGKTWGPHLDKLKRILDDRVLFMGDPKRIVLR